MDHLRFKSEQTAAAYVADALDASAREQFELHMMSCSECVEEVEGWRALKSCLPRDATLGHSSRAAGTAPNPPGSAPNPAGSSPRPADAALCSAGKQAPTPSHRPAAPAPVSQRSAAPVRVERDAAATASARWRLAAALAAGLLVGAVGGWYGRSSRGPAVDSANIGFYSLPPLTRGPSDCTSVHVDPPVSLLAVRVPAAAKEQRLVAVDGEGHDLAPQDYSVRTQADGSWLVRLRAETVRDQGIRFEARSADGTVEPRGCVLNDTQD